MEVLGDRTPDNGTRGAIFGSSPLLECGAELVGNDCGNLPHSSAYRITLRVMHKADRVLAVCFGVALFALASVWTVDRYGGASYWPSLVAQFAATLVAVVLALEFESRRENRALKLIEDQKDATRTTEARKRLLAVRLELEKNKTSIGEIVEGVLPSAGTWRILHPQLFDGAWSASGERLGDLLADYELVSDLSVFYGRVEELRWRVRYRTQSRDPGLDGMTHALADEMRNEVEDLLRRVEAQERKPGVRGVTHVGRLVGSVGTTATLTTEKLTKESGREGD